MPTGKSSEWFSCISIHYSNLNSALFFFGGKSYWELYIKYALSYIVINYKWD
jgi:hypothetical protein